MSSATEKTNSDTNKLEVVKKNIKMSISPSRNTNRYKNNINRDTDHLIDQFNNMKMSGDNRSDNDGSIDDVSNNVKDHSDGSINDVSDNVEDDNDGSINDVSNDKKVFVNDIPNEVDSESDGGDEDEDEDEKTPLIRPKTQFVPVVPFEIDASQVIKNSTLEKEREKFIKWLNKVIIDKDHGLIHQIFSSNSFAKSKEELLINTLYNLEMKKNKNINKNKKIFKKKYSKKSLQKFFKKNPEVVEDVFDKVKIMFKTFLQNPTVKTHNILLFGKCGTGKSTLILILAYILNFSDNSSYVSDIKTHAHTSCTKDVTCYNLTVMGTKFNFWDIPGTGDPDKKNFKDSDIIAKIKKQTENDVIDAILLVSDISEPRFDQLDRNDIINITKTYKFLGPNLWDNIIVVFTKSNAIRLDDDFENYDPPENDVKKYNEEFLSKCKERILDYHSHFLERIRSRSQHYKDNVKKICEKVFDEHYVGRDILYDGNSGNIVKKSGNKIIIRYLEKHVCKGLINNTEETKEVDKKNVKLIGLNIKDKIKDKIKNLNIIPLGYVQKKINQKSKEICKCKKNQEMKNSWDQKKYKDCCKKNDYRNCEVNILPNYSKILHVPDKFFENELYNLNKFILDNNALLCENWVHILHDNLVKVGSSEFCIHSNMIEYLKTIDSNIEDFLDNIRRRNRDNDGPNRFGEEFSDYADGQGGSSKLLGTIVTLGGAGIGAGGAFGITLASSSTAITGALVGGAIAVTPVGWAIIGGGAVVGGCIGLYSYFSS
jgi:predicted GTPase